MTIHFPFRLTLIFAMIALLISCKKSGSAVSGITGEWSINSRVGSSFYANGSPGLSNFTEYHTGAAVKVSFEDNGNFQFVNKGVSSGGTYVFTLKDSLLTITPDNAAFLNYCYFGPDLQFATGTPMESIPSDPLYDTPGILYMNYRSKDSMELSSSYILSGARSADSIVLTRNGLRKLQGF